jgi:hypothetical protein
VAEEEYVSIGPQAADEGGARGCANGQALGTDWDLTVVADANLGLETPDKVPPRAGWEGTQNGAFFGKGLNSGSLRGGAQFAMDLIEIDVGQELIQQFIGLFEVADVIGSEQGRQALLPEGMAAFDFAFGLRGGSVKEGDAVEMEGGAQLGESVRGVRKEKGMVIDVKRQRKAMRLEGPGQEIQMSQEIFGRIEASADIVAGGVIQDVQKHLFIRLFR